MPTINELLSPGVFPEPQEPFKDPHALSIDELEEQGYPDAWERPEGDTTVGDSIDDAMAFAGEGGYVPGWRDGPPVMVSRSSLANLTRGSHPYFLADTGRTYQGQPVKHLCKSYDRTPREPGQEIAPLSRQVYQPVEV